MARADTETEILWPELGDAPEHKAILRTAKKLHKIRTDRKEALTESKALEDKTQEDLVGMLHEAKIEKFKHGQIVVHIKPKSEKVVVKIEAEEDEEEAADKD